MRMMGTIVIPVAIYPLSSMWQFIPPTEIFSFTVIQPLRFFIRMNNNNKKGNRNLNAVNQPFPAVITRE